MTISLQAQTSLARALQVRDYTRVHLAPHAAFDVAACSVTLMTGGGEALSRESLAEVAVSPRVASGACTRRHDSLHFLFKSPGGRGAARVVGASTASEASSPTLDGSRDAVGAPVPRCVHSQVAEP
jgi:hypothetical protein